MIHGDQCKRLAAMGFLMAVAFAGLGYRLVDLQVIRHDEFREESEEITRKTVLRAPKRGDIRDIRGNLLASSIFVKTVCADPTLIGEHRAEVARALAPLLQLPEAHLYQQMAPRLITTETGAVKPCHSVRLKRKVPVETWERIQAAMQQIPAGVDALKVPKSARERLRQFREMSIFTEPLDDELRIYPNQTLASHILGYVGGGVCDSPKGKVDEQVGRDGIELTMNAALRGVIGWRKTEVANRELVAFRDQEVEARPGRNVILTMDAGVQHIVESELAEAMKKHTPISACGLVVRPRTGEILAMANFPNFDPNDLASSTEDSRRNRMITDMAEPGSTFKIVVISGALNDGTTTLEEKFNCENGRFIFGGIPLRDHEPYGVLSVEEIIMHSSNIGAAKVGIKMGNDRLYKYVRDFGFGTRTGVPLYGEVGGWVHPVKRWSKVSISRIPMGHEVAVTPLQMMMAMCAVANEGRLMRPMLVDRLEDAQGETLFKNYPQPVRQVISPHAAKLMVTALKTVMSTNGTGKKAVLEHYTVAGKTGTAQKIVDHKYRRDKHFSSFIGFFPADEPEICVGVFLDEPKNGYYGGEAAAPIFRDIAERIGKYLAIKPDVLPPVTPTGTGTTAAIF